jgi:hypothetical protein
VYVYVGLVEGKVRVGEIYGSLWGKVGSLGVGVEGMDIQNLAVGQTFTITHTHNYTNITNTTNITTPSNNTNTNTNTTNNTNTNTTNNTNFDNTTNIPPPITIISIIK